MPVPAATPEEPQTHEQAQQHLPTKPEMIAAGSSPTAVMPISQSQQEQQPATQPVDVSNTPQAVASSGHQTSRSQTITPTASPKAHSHSRAENHTLTASSPPDLCVTWLGTSSGNPSLRRNVSCIALTLGRSVYLVDCGEGTSRQVLRANLDPACIKGVFISHLHGDHCFGLPGLIELVSKAHKESNSPAANRSLEVYGPPGIQQLVKGAFAVSLVHAALSDTFLSKH